MLEVAPPTDLLHPLALITIPVMPAGGVFNTYNRSLVALEFYLFKKIKRAVYFRCRSIMKPQTKRSFCLGVFLVIVTLVVLYSYCNGNSVCYTFPLFNGMDRDRLVKPQAEMVVTSVIVQTKRPIDMGTIPKKHKGTNDETSVKLSELHTKPEKGVEQKKTPNITGTGEKLHFHQNRTSLEKYLFSLVEEKANTTRAKETHEVTKHPLPPSDIVGKVAEEILRKANISEEEANRELIRVEKVDEFVDKEKQHKKLNQHEHSLLDMVKESRGAGGKDSERKLVRVERVDLTDEEEEEDRKLEKQVQPAQKNSRYQERANSSRTEPTGISEDSESAHARRFGKTIALNTTLKGNTSKISEVNKTREAVTITPPPFFAKFLNVTAHEREMIDFLHNYTDNNNMLDRRKSNKTLQRNGTEKEEHEMAQRTDMPSAQAHADKVDVREKRDHKEGDFHDTLQPLLDKLLNLTGDRQAGAKNTSENLKGPFNLSNIFRKITTSNQGDITKDLQTSVPDSTALLVRFLQEGSRHRLRMPKNGTAVHTDKDKSKIADAKLGNNKLQPPLQGGLNLKKILLELANHINLTRHHNQSKTTSESREGKADLAMLKLLINQSTFEDYSAFNLSGVLKEIAGNSLKSLEPNKEKRDKDTGELGSTSSQSDLKIFRPDADKLETGKPELVFNTKKKPSSSINGEGSLASANGSLNTTSVHVDSNKNNTSSSSGSGSGETGNEESAKSSDSEKRKNRNETATGNSEKKQRSKLGRNGILKFDTICCEALDPKVLLYNRIFKTGSSTTESVITNSSSSMNYAYKIGTTEDWYDEGKSHPYPGLIIRKANKKLIKYPRMAFVAHFYFRRNLNLPQTHTYINQVRDPVRRLVSHYHYMRSSNRPAYRIKEFRASGELNESLEKCFRRQHKGCQNNVMTRFFCGRHFYCRRGNGHALHKAMNNIRRYYATVGLLEHYGVYLQILHKRLPKFFPKVSNQDIGKFKYNPKYSFDDVSQELIGAITRANWADVKLYSFVKKRFWQQAKTCGIRAQSN
ncbi:hypothetical protein ACROYT_G036560 [Oculina patagonica]